MQRLRREGHVKTEAKCNDMPTSQGTSRVAGRHKKLKCRTNSASEVPEVIAPMAPWFLTSGLQYWRRIKLQSFGHLLMAVLQN